MNLNTKLKPGRPALTDGRTVIINIRLSPAEKSLLEAGAAREQRSQSDYVRWLIRKADKAELLREAAQRG